MYNPGQFSDEQDQEPTSGDMWRPVVLWLLHRLHRKRKVSTEARRITLLRRLSEARWILHLRKDTQGASHSSKRLTGSKRLARECNPCVPIDRGQAVTAQSRHRRPSATPPRCVPQEKISHLTLSSSRASPNRGRWPHDNDAEDPLPLSGPCRPPTGSRLLHFKHFVEESSEQLYEARPVKKQTFRL